MPSRKSKQQSESWSKWLLSIFLLCFFQGWLLAQASILVGVFFAILTLPTIAIVSGSSHRTAHQHIFSKPILTCWSVAIAWTIAGSIADLQAGAVNIQVTAAVGVTMLIASAIAWAWVIAAIEICTKVLGSYGWIDKLIIVATCSWLGLGLGWAISAWL
ncbi:hypothetical protein Pse7367_0317 [Thalassoporum mexicanum PCC 7367]|uniref:hypothetical protein n=1 Tax=Thalassoporum mexicanum TaxID=3457544 RepID=UPI00029FC9CC|nr:hypothetical protein [Pseudanabaena sp. PCC 7367]AFY68630.1 hypothetical protein Pse7367_0317 [Pseudanabaena sp. PCC 7367]